MESLPEVLETIPGWSKISVAEDRQSDFRIRALLQDREIQFRVEVKSSSWTPANLDGLRHQLHSKDRMPVVLAAAWISPKVAKSLREAGLCYLDTAGNIHLDFPGIYVYRETTDRPLVELDRKRQIGETFNPTTTRVALQLLMDPELVKVPYRRLAELSGVSLRSVKLAMDAFKCDGHVQDAGVRGIHFSNREDFFQKWVEGYNQRLRPKARLARYSTGKDRIDAAIILDGSTACCWGGDKGANTWTRALKTTESLIYVYDKPGPLIARNRLRIDPDGEIELFQATWKPDQESMPLVAPVFVLYADLLWTRDPRCLEVAQQLLEKEIRRRLDG